MALWLEDGLLSKNIKTEQRKADTEMRQKSIIGRIVYDIKKCGLAATTKETNESLWGFVQRFH